MPLHPIRIRRLNLFGYNLDWLGESKRYLEPIELDLIRILTKLLDNRFRRRHRIVIATVGPIPFSF